MIQKSESEIFSKLESLCSSDGFIHVLALLSCMNNTTFYEEELSSTDMQHLYEKERLIRTEISTIAGLLLKSEVNMAYPGEAVLSQLTEDVNSSLAVLHRAMYSGDRDGEYDNKMIKESVFYSGESAYDFQYLDMAEEKYAQDNSWFLEYMGFSCSEMVSVGRCVESIIGRKVSDFLRRGLGMFNEGLLKAYELSIDLIATETGLISSKVKAIVDLFSSQKLSNENFCDMSSFNVYNARPIICVDNTYFCFSAYSLAQSIYETLFFG